MGYKGVTKNKKIIDLHGMTKDQALQECIRALNDSKINEEIFFITGKGNHSAGGDSVLKKIIQKTIFNMGHRWRYAKLSDGGSGVVIVTKCF